MTEREVADLIQQAYHHGVDTLHVSSEYDSFELLLGALNQLPLTLRCKLRFIVKLGCPQFDEPKFSKEKLVARVDEYLRQLGCERLDVVQWMWRSNLDNDDARCAAYIEQSVEVSSAFAQLQLSGKVGQVACFPYSTNFMKQVRLSELTKIQINYSNLYENHMQQAGTEPVSIALRPFAAGRVFIPENAALIGEIASECDIRGTQSSAALALRFTLLNPYVAASVVSVSSVEQLQFCCNTLNETIPDLQAYKNLEKLQLRLAELQ